MKYLVVTERYNDKAHKNLCGCFDEFETDNLEEAKRKAWLCDSRKSVYDEVILVIADDYRDGNYNPIEYDKEEAR
jgi:hypothetical protein